MRAAMAVIEEKHDWRRRAEAAERELADVRSVALTNAYNRDKANELTAAIAKERDEAVAEVRVFEASVELLRAKLAECDRELRRRDPSLKGTELAPDLGAGDPLVDPLARIAELDQALARIKAAWIRDDSEESCRTCKNLAPILRDVDSESTALCTEDEILQAAAIGRLRQRCARQRRELRRLNRKIVALNHETEQRKRDMESPGPRYECAPCGCKRCWCAPCQLADFPATYSCAEHARDWPLLGCYPWEAASALQAGLRAIAEAPGERPDANTNIYGNPGGPGWTKR